MSHLGRWLSALVDGELDGMERDRVLNHVAGCDACRREANAMRALKRRLTALGETCAETAIAGRLIELAHGGQGPAADVPHRSRAWGSADDFGSFSRWRARLNRLGLTVATASAGSALIAIAVIAFLLGSGSGGPPVPKVTPSVDSYLLQHSRDAGQEPARAGTVAPASGNTGHRRYKAGPVSPDGLVRPAPIHGRAQIGRLHSPVGTGSSPGPVASMTASPEPAASAAAGQGPLASATPNPTGSSSSQTRRSAGSRTATDSSR